MLNIKRLFCVTSVVLLEEFKHEGTRMWMITNPAQNLQT